MPPAPPYITSGQILFDGEEQGVSVISLRQAISFVSQSPQLFNVSDAEHIRFDKPGATDEEVRHAASVAQAGDFIKAMSEGFNTLWVRAEFVFPAVRDSARSLRVP